MNAKPIRLLLLEDNEDDALLVKMALAPGEFDITWVERLAHALARIQAEHFDVVLSDLGLPDSTGLATLQEISELAPALPLVVLTGVNDEKLGRAAIEHGAQDFLTKGQSDEAFIARTLRYAIERKRLEMALRGANEALEERVAKRTADLETANNTLRASQERFDLAVRGSSDGIWDWNVLTNEEYFSERWCELLGYCKEEMQPTFALWKSLLHPHDHDKVLRQVRQHLRRRQPYAVEFRLRKKGGEYGWFLARGQAVWNERGRSTRVSGSLTDITERKQAEAELRIAATAFESQEGIFVTDATNVILRVNRAFTQITGYSAEEAVGQAPSLLNSGRHDKAFFAAMWESIDRSGTWQGEIWNRRKNGDVYPEWLNITAVKGHDGAVTHYVGTQTDITARKAAEDEIRYLAYYDPLTRLPNRRLLMDRLQQALAISARNKRLGALLFIDLDDFKTLNDSLGHDKGDLLLQQVGQRLALCMREGDTVARLGGDEFVVMLEDLSEGPAEGAAQVETVGEKILTTLNQIYLLAGQRHHSTPSIGATLFSGNEKTMDELLKQADLAMYQAKTAGRNTLRFFDPQMQAAVTARVSLEADLREGLRKNQFFLHYQAQVDGEGRLTGAEALVRWRHPVRGMVSPAEFIPLTETTGLILPLGQWVLESACAQMVAWAGQAETAHLSMAVNVSARQFRHPDFVEQVLAVLDHSGADPRKLKLEITESMLLEDVQDIIDKMSALKTKGVGFSLDDFGTGYSSLTYLKRLPLDQLKIDQSFVRDLLTDSNDAAIAHTIVALADSLGLSVIAEGVETEEQRDFLARQGCHAYQGYLFGRPGPAEELKLSRFFNQNRH